MKDKIENDHRTAEDRMLSTSGGQRVTFQSAPNPLLHAIAMLAFVLHIGGGLIALASGAVAAFARKGGYLHRTGVSVQ
jgi:hypothetical protein